MHENTPTKAKKQSGFSKDLADVSHKAVRKQRFVSNNDRSGDTKGRGARKGNFKGGNDRVPKQKGGKVNKGKKR